MEKQNVSKNFVLQILYQCIVFVIPLIISPYLTRILGDTALGVYTFSNSIARYFVMFAMLGIAKYGQRLISKSINNDEDLRKSYWSLFLTHGIFSIIAILLYFTFCMLFVNSDKDVYLIQIIYVFSGFFDITWLFYGLENFKSVVSKNLFIKLLECILIFIFVKDENDLNVYTIIVSSSLLASNTLLFIQGLVLIKPIKVCYEDCKVHIKPLLFLSISVIAVTMYTIFDKTLLGLLSTKEDVAYYEYAYKIINVPIIFISTIGTVIFPRACKYVKENNTNEIEKYIEVSINVTSFIGFGSFFGILAIGKMFAYFYYGESFITSGYTMMMMAIIPLLTGIGDILRTQFLIPREMDKQYTICIVLNALINLLTSCILIPIIGIYGAVVGTILAELFGCIYQIILCKEFIKIKTLLINMMPYIIFGLIMFGIIIILKEFVTYSIVGLIIIILVGLISYSALALLYVWKYKKNTIKTLLEKD